MLLIFLCHSLTFSQNHVQFDKFSSFCLDNFLNIVASISVTLNILLPSSSNESYLSITMLAKICSIQLRKFSIILVVFEFRTIFTPLFQCSSIFHLYYEPHVCLGCNLFIADWGKANFFKGCSSLCSEPKGKIGYSSYWQIFKFHKIGIYSG